MTVNEAIKILQKLSKKGYGNLPFQLLVVEDGITYAYDIQIEKACKYDGERVWIYQTERHNPEWMKNG